MGDENNKGLNMFVELYINGIPVSQFDVVNMYTDDNNQCVLIVENELTKYFLSKLE